jgi:hypothetical protein
MMVGKKKKKSAVRPVVSLRVRPAMYEDLVREAEQRRIKLSEEVERRLIRYEEMIADANEVDDANRGSRFDPSDPNAWDKIAERIANRLNKKLKPE